MLGTRPNGFAERSAASLIGSVEGISSPGWAGGPGLSRNEGDADDPIAMPDDRGHDLGGNDGPQRDISVKSVRRLAAHYGRAPDQLSEAEVRSYLIKLRDRGVARGTFKVAHYAVQFLYQQTLGCDWPLFSKKKIRLPKHKRLPHALADDQVRHLLGCVKSPVHKACLSVVYACGLRISEARTLEIGAIDRANLTLHIIGKATRNGGSRCRNRCSQNWAGCG